MTKNRVIPGAYGILCLANRKYYIGSSGDIEKRIAEHRSQLRANRHFQLPRLQKDWNEMGEFAFAFARYPCPAEHRKHFEQQLIESLQTLEHQHGYNKMVGSRWGVEARIRNSESKFSKKGRFSFMPGVHPEEPMLQIYIRHFTQSVNKELLD